MSSILSVASAVGFCTKSTAPASSALSTRSLDSAAMLTTTIGSGRTRHLPADELDAVGAGHDQVARHHVGLAGARPLQRVLAVPGRADHFQERAARQHLLDDLAHVRGVVDDQHPDHSLHQTLSLRSDNGEPLPDVAAASVLFT